VYSPSAAALYTSKQAKALNVTDGIKHPTQKPIKLTQKLLDGCLHEDGAPRVVIPFAGTGSEALVCKQNNLKWIAFEINKDYADMSNLLVQRGFPTNKKRKTSE